MSNATSGGSPQQISHLVQAGAIPPLCQLLAVNDAKVVTVALEGLENILSKLPVEHRGITHQIFVECGGVDRLTDLQQHENVPIYQRAVRVLETHFGDEEEADSAVAPQVVAGGLQYGFGGPAAPPGGGGGFQQGFMFG